MESKYTLGLDYGTSSVRAILVDVSNGRTVGEGVFEYRNGVDGVIVDRDDPHLARQDPDNYMEGFIDATRTALKHAGGESDFSPDKIIGIGVDTTGSSPMPVLRDNTPLSRVSGFEDEKDVLVWLWKDHTGHLEAQEITKAGREMRPQYLNKIGNTYSSEWFWAKVWHCMRVNPEVYDTAFTWVEICDWIPAVMSGVNDALRIKRGITAAGHKAMYNPEWGGYPDEEFTGRLDRKLLKLRRTLPDRAYELNEIAGYLDKNFAEELGLIPGIPIAVGSFDAHFGGIGSGIEPGTLVKNIGTSCCDIMVAPMEEEMTDIPGLCGIVPGSVLPGYYGLEAGQSAIGDIHGWFAGMIAGGRDRKEVFRQLEEEAGALRPGESGLMALDWMNGNRTVLVDQRLTGLFVGLTLHTSAAEMYKALLEATAFGARIIAERFQSYGVEVKRVINCGGIPYKSPHIMQIYADVFDRTMELSQSNQTASLGSAIAGAVVAGPEAGGYADYKEAIGRMTGVLDTAYTPIKENVPVYEELFSIYRELHDAFGVEKQTADLYPVMKRLLEIRERVKGGE